MAQDNMQATPRNPTLGLFSDSVGSLNDLAQGNPATAFLSDAASLPALQRTLDRLSYGDSLGTGTGYGYHLRPDTTEAIGGMVGVLPYGKAGGLFSSGVHNLDTILQGIYNKIGSKLK